MSRHADFWNDTVSLLSPNHTMAGKKNSTGSVSYEYEYYYDYLDPVFVDQSKLHYNRYSIVIIFWMILAAFIGLLFLSLNLMSRSINIPMCHRSKIKRRGRASA